MGGVGGRSLSAGVPGQLRRSAAACVRLGHAQHQQPQRADSQEVLPGRSRLLPTLRPPQRRLRSPKACHLRQGPQKTTRFVHRKNLSSLTYSEKN